MFTLGVNATLRIGGLLYLGARDVFGGRGELVVYLPLREQKARKAKRMKLNKPAQDALRYSKVPPTNPAPPLFPSLRSG